MGGATGLIGDPSGKQSERPMLAKEEINKNIKGIEKTLNDVICNIYSHVEREQPDLMELQILALMQSFFQAQS